VPPSIRGLTAAQRLDYIIWEQRIRGFPPFGPEGVPIPPMVCFSESPADHLDWLLRKNWPQWGVFVRREWVYAQGGGPVWYARPDQYNKFTPEQFAWAVRFEDAPRRSDWVHEREWRIPVPPADPEPALHLAPGDVVAVLVGDPMWQPSTRWWPQPAGMPPVPAAPPLWGSFRRWFWDPANGSVTDLDLPY
jgi:hypothetical protein